MKAVKNGTLKAVTILGVTATIPEAFEEGNKVSVAEASALNQLVRENIRNNVASQMKSAEKAGNPVEDVQAFVDEYFANYEFGMSSSGRVTDPIAKEAKAIATQMVMEALKAQGYTKTAIGNEKFNELVATQMEKENVQELAVQRVEAANALGNVVLNLD